MVQNHYYQHSGQFALGSVILGTIAAAAMGSVLAAAYAAVVLYIPFAGVISFILSIGFGVLLGLTIAAALRWAKVRHEGILFLSSATAASSALYVSWAVWTWLLLRQSDVEAHVLALVQKPAFGRRGTCLRVRAVAVEVPYGRQGARRPARAG